MCSDRKWEEWINNQFNYRHIKDPLAGRWFLFLINSVNSFCILNCDYNFSSPISLYSKTITNIDVHLYLAWNILFVRGELINWWWDCRVRCVIYQLISKNWKWSIQRLIPSWSNCAEHTFARQLYFKRTIFDVLTYSMSKHVACIRICFINELLAS